MDKSTVGIILGWLGLAMLICFVGGFAALGVFLCLWGNNLERKDR